MTSEEPAVEPPSDEEPPPPPPPELEPPPPPKTTAEPAEPESAWIEDYEEHIDAEEAPPPRPKKKRRYGGYIILVAIIVFLVIWTVLSPKVMPQAGTTYLERGSAYANLGNFTGYRDIWAGNMTWGLSISGPENATVGVPATFSVLITKVYEKPGNWFFRGSAITLKNVSVYDVNGTFLGAMSGSTDMGFGPLASVPVTFERAGIYDLYVYAKFLVNMDMRIGFLPLEAVQIEPAYFDVPITVT